MKEIIQMVGIINNTFRIYVGKYTPKGICSAPTLITANGCLTDVHELEKRIKYGMEIYLVMKSGVVVGWFRDIKKL